MRFYWSILTLEELNMDRIAVHALDPKSANLYTYSQELKSWHLDQAATENFFNDTKDQTSNYEEINHNEIYALLPLVDKMDRRNTTQRQISNTQRSQIRKSGQVCTSAEMGLLTKYLRQRPTTMPWLKEMVETRSQHKRWTAVFLYEKDGQNRRKAISDLRRNSALATSSKGHRLQVQHRKKHFSLDGQRRTYIAVEIKYVKPKSEESRL